MSRRIARVLNVGGQLMALAVSIPVCLVLSPLWAYAWACERPIHDTPNQGM